jgi:hypothetical protein
VRWSFSVIRKLLVLCILGTDCPRAQNSPSLSVAARRVLVKHSFDNVRVNMDIADRSVAAVTAYASKDSLASVLT